MSEEYTEEEKELIRVQLREGNRLAREAAIKHGVKAHPRIGKFKADYSALTPEEINVSDPELEELYRNSTPLPRS